MNDGYEDILIAWGMGTRSVRAEIYGPLAVHESFDDSREWMITHINTGKFLSYFDDKIRAEGCAIELRRKFAVLFDEWQDPSFSPPADAARAIRDIIRKWQRARTTTPQAAYFATFSGE